MLARPLLLVALLSLPVLVLLARVLSRRREVAVSSLLLWRRLGLVAEPPVRARRESDRLLLLRLAAAALISLALAGPMLARGAGPPELVVLVDDSPSMAPFAAAADAAVVRVREAVPGAGLRVRRSPGLSGLAAALAAGDGDVVAITDHPLAVPAGERVRVVLVGERVENVGVVSAWIEDGADGPRFAAVVRNFSDRPLARTVGGVSAEIAAGEARRFEGEAPGGRAEIRIEPGDAFAFDDRVVLAREPARRVALAWRGPEEPRLRAALEAAGVLVDPEAPGSLAYRVAPRETDRLVVAPPGTVRAPGSAGTSGGAGVPPDAVPGPRIGLGPVTPPPGGEVLLFDGEGPVATMRAGRVTVGIDPASPGAAWARDPSFPIFFAEVARRFGAAAARTVVLEGTIDPEESATRAAGGGGDLRGLVPGPPAGEPGPLDLSPGLLLAAAALLVLHSLRERAARHGLLSSTS